MMKLDSNRLVIYTILLATFLFVFQAMAGEKVYLMTGKIAAINQDSNTVVIEVPLENGLFTVGGPLTSSAVLKKGGKSARLSDFKVGEQVKVRWRSTKNGHVIEMIDPP
jgi:hypothetical protein